MKIENTQVFGFGAAFRAMRNPRDSWDKSDSVFGCTYNVKAIEKPYIGEKDLELAQKLIKAGSAHRKFLRQLIICVDWTLPRYVWTEVDTYKVATVRNSCSTMHTLGKRDLVQEDFQYSIFEVTLTELNKLCKSFRESSGKKKNELLRELKNNLPEGFLQKSTMTFNYETALNMYWQRKNHKLIEWNDKEDNKLYSVCKWIKDLPYMKDFLNEEGE